MRVSLQQALTALGLFLLGAPGIHAAGVISFNPSSLTFQTADVGVLSAAQTITVSNNGTVAVTFSSVALTGSNPGDFLISKNTCGTLSPNASCAVSIEFEPSANGTRTANLQFTDNAAGSPQIVPLTGTGQSATAGLTFTPGTLAFPLTTVGSSSSTQGAVTNYGSAAVVFSGFSFSGPNSTEFAISDNLCTTLGTGIRCTFEVTFTPAAPGVRTANLAIADTAAGSPQNVPVMGTAQAATQALWILYAPVSFGFQDVGVPSAQNGFTIQNVGTAAVSIAGVVLGGSDPSDFSITQNTCPATLPVAYQCDMAATFTPSTTGQRSATITITGGAGPQVVNLYGTGQAVTNRLSFFESTVDLGVQTIGLTSAPSTVNLISVGTGTVTIGSIAIAGTNATEFAIGYNNCLVPLSPQYPCDLTVVFTPTAVGVRTATLTFTDNATGSPQVVNLKGTGTKETQVLSFNFPNFDFQGALVGTPSGYTLDLTLTNQGDAPVSFTSVLESGPNAADFAFFNLCSSSGATLPVQGTCTVSVTFTPSAAGVRTATLTFSDSATGSPQTVTLSGFGLPVTQTLNFRPPVVVFPATTVGSPAAGTYYTDVSNTGDTELTVSSELITGGNSGDFGTTGGPCSGFFPIGYLCTAYLTFTPSAGGIRTSSLQFTDTAAGSPQSVTLVGGGEPVHAALTFTPGDYYFGTQNIGTTSSANSISVFNDFPGTITLSTQLTGANASDFAITANSCGPSLAEFGSCSVTFTFSPSGLGTRIAALQATGNGAAQDAVLAGAGTAAAANLTLPTALDFGVVNIAAASAQQFLEVQNSGTEAVSFTGFAITGTNASDFAITADQCGSSLAVGQICNLGLTFTPAAGNERTATLQISDNATGSPQAVALSGIGQTAAQTLTLPSGLDFGVVTLGSSPTQSFYVYNTGTAAVTFSKLAIVGANPSDFAIASGCTQINPGYFCLVQLVFNPSAAGMRTAVLSLTDGAAGSPQSVPLTGVGVAASAVMIVPSTVAFGAVAVGSPYNKILVVTNTGNASLTFISQVIGGTNAADFAIVDYLPPIGAGGTYLMTIVFTPTASGVRTASLQFADNATGSPQTLLLTGVGDPVTTTLLTPSAVAFPAVTLGFSNTQSATVQNIGTQTITIRTAQIAGPNAGDFVVGSACPPLTFAGYPCAIPIVFTPSGSGVRTAILKLTDNATGSPQSISLTGDGQAPTASIDLSPSSMNFGSVNVGSSESPENGSIFNTGSANVTITGLSITGPNAGDFVVFSNGCDNNTVSPGSTCVYQIAFIPTATGARSATLQISDNAVGSPQAVALSGTGK
jgi:hypothetical protein